MLYYKTKMARRTRKIKRSRSRKVRRVSRRTLGSRKTRRTRRTRRKKGGRKKSRRRLTRKSGGGISRANRHALESGEAQLYQAFGRGPQENKLRKGIKKLANSFQLTEYDQKLVFDAIKGVCLFQRGDARHEPKRWMVSGLDPEEKCQGEANILQTFLDAKIKEGYQFEGHDDAAAALTLQKKLGKEAAQRRRKETQNSLGEYLPGMDGDSPDGVETFKL